MIRATLALLLFAMLTGAAPDYESDIRPLLKVRCLSCHGDEADLAGGLDLRFVRTMAAGGDGGPAIIPGDAEHSLLLQRVIAGEMPPEKGRELASDEIQLLRDWIAAGAAVTRPEPMHLPAPGEPFLTDADRDHWSLKPLTRPAIPAVDGAKPQARAGRNPVDAFVGDRLSREGLAFSVEADRETLVRRLYFDLLGLPPTPDEIQAFVADDRPDACERLVDRLLASPHYGERWARHWLDIVHFGETHGYDKDKPRPNAWPYRDYVIRAFNSDKPYRQFVAEQVAGDVLAPGTRDGIEALGFIAAGPWDFIGHAEVPESKIDGQIARHLDRDDMVQNTITTFLSLTVGCAQCHDHKFDPIPQADYYSLQAVFAALDRTEREYDLDPQTAAIRATLLAQRQSQQAELARLDALIADACGPELADIDRQIAAAAKPGERPPEYGYHSGIEPRDDVEKWVQIDLGETVAIHEVRLFPCHDDFNSIGPGFGFPRRFRIAVSDDAGFADGGRTVVDQTAADVPNPGTVRQAFRVGGISGRYLRITATRLAPRQNDFIFAIAEAQVLDTGGVNRAAGRSVTALDSIEAPVRWRKSNLVDGLYPDGALDAGQLDALRTTREALIEQRVAAEVRAQRTAAEQSIAAVTSWIAALPRQQVVYAGGVHHGSGPFEGTGPRGGKPREIRLLRRGDVTKPGPVMSPGALSAVGTLPARFELPESAPEGERRAALARWLTDDRNPLVWRSIANRVWQYHFGRGLVGTPGDFGRMGDRPTHPELLDWLACELRDNGGSLKDLHRLLLTSRTYRQSSRTADSPVVALAMDRDPENRLWWRMERRQLEAEAVRDSLLAVAGCLNTEMGGPSFQDFVIEKPEHSPHYEYHLHDPSDPRSHRRSVYRFLVRSNTQPFMTVLDCADPSMMVDQRTRTVTPLQALTLLNSGFALTMAERFAARLVTEHDDESAQVRAGFALVTGRLPTDEELRLLEDYRATYGLANTCRMLLNLNELLFVN